ncbi:MAG: hypothetical protein CM15mP47_1180 [Methanobacteriota archaeon]|nr:MAG: hypothetical protein CM15mP47_1180 [Euryarchaeota archaeon]
MYSETIIFLITKPGALTQSHNELIAVVLHLPRGRVIIPPPSVMSPPIDTTFNPTLRVPI